MSAPTEPGRGQPQAGESARGPGGDAGLAERFLARLEAERMAVAHELHDAIGGALAAVRFDLAWIERHGSAAVATRAREATTALGEAMEAAQRLARDLRPPALDDGLDDALRELVERFRRRSGAQVDLAITPGAHELDEARALVVYRTAQECLTNVLRHARATSVRIDLVASPGQVSLEVSDNGIGLAADEPDGGPGLGLRGLAERARQAGGWLEADDTGHGSTILLTLPLPGGDA